MAIKMEGTGWVEVLAYDPGGTTGWAVICITPKALLSEKPINKGLLRHFAHGQIVGSEHLQVDQLVELVDVWPQAAVVGESFIQRIRNTALETDEAYSPVRINAIIKWWLATEDRYLFKQTPAMAKDAMTDERLEQRKLSPDGGHAARHSRDAVRHAVLFLNRARQKPSLRFNAWPHLFNEQGELL